MYLVVNFDLTAIPTGHRVFQAEDLTDEILDSIYRGKTQAFVFERGVFKKISVSLAPYKVVELSD